MNDSQTRSVVKTLTWRLTGSLATFVISYAIAGDFAVASSIAVIQIIANTLLYYVHERIWVRIGWGKN